ncbi:MAG: hypothetical protein ACTSYS_10270 [Promethearchaeota archaeon]
MKTEGKHENGFFKGRFRLILLFCGLVIVMGSLLRVSAYNFTPGVDNGDSAVGTVNIQELEGIRPSAGTPHDPIVIGSDAELDSFADKSGAGNESDPYVIQGFTFNSTAQILVDLQHLHSRYLVIRNCTFIQEYGIGTTPQAIYISNSSHVTIENSYFINSRSNTSYQVIKLSDVNHVTIRNNYFTRLYSKLTEINIVIIQDSSDEITIEDNIVEDIDTPSSFITFYSVDSTSNLQIVNNTIRNIKAGLLFYLLKGMSGGTNVLIENNRVDNVTTELTILIIFLSSVEDSVINNNTITNQVAQYIYIFQIGYSLNITISNNVIKYGSFMNYMAGVYFLGTNKSTVINNYLSDYISHADAIGIDLIMGSDSNIIVQNYVLFGHIPARDLGSNNLWSMSVYFQVTHRYQVVGNYYWNYTGEDKNHDYVGDTPQKIYNGTDYAPIVYGALDNDNDNLTNYEEEQHGTDPNARDTDLDGLDDYVEIKIMGTSALCNDTDGDGVLDGLDPYPLDPEKTTNNKGIFDDISMVEGMIISSIILSAAIAMFSIVQILIFKTKNKGVKRKTSKIEKE